MKDIQIIKEKELRSLPKELQEKIKKNETEIKEFTSWAQKEFKDYILGLSIIPKELSILDDESNNKNQKNNKDDKIHIFILLDEIKKENPAKIKINAIQKSIEKTKESKIKPEIMMLSELWSDCYDADYDILKIFSLGYNLLDNGLFSAIKIAEIHKLIVLEKFEKYIVSYVLAGSLVRGEATPTSDVDVFVVVDDTDVKRMTRVELKEKLRAIILESAFIAGEKTGIKNKLNVQVYILTEFWDSLRQANPIIYTFLRDGVPMYDRGIFMPWKQLLRMGMIQPSPEAVERLMETGDKIIESATDKIKDMVIEDLYYAILTPSQAALMKFGVAPPAPKETATLMRALFIEKEHLLEEKYVKMLEEVIKIRKDLEHGKIEKVTVEDLQKFMRNAEQFQKRIKKLFSEIEERKEKEIIVKIYDDIITLIREGLKLEDLKKVSESEIRELFEEHFIKTGKLANHFLRQLDEILEAYHLYQNKNANKLNMNHLRQISTEFAKALVEFLQKQSFKKYEEYKIKLKANNSIYDLIQFNEDTFLVNNEKNKVLILDNNFNKQSEISIDEFIKLRKEKELKRITLTKDRIENLEKTLNTKIEIIL